MIGTHSVLMALPEVAAHLQQGKSKAYELRRAQPKPKHAVAADRLAIVELTGAIDSISAGRVIAELSAAAANSRIESIAMLVDSGGGYADASAALGEVVGEVAQLKPVHVHV